MNDIFAGFKMVYSFYFLNIKIIVKAEISDPLSTGGEI